MKILFRILKWTALVVLTLVLVLFGSWLLLPDQKLEPAVRQVLEKPVLPPADQNAYFLVWGITASPEVDPHEAGQKIVAEYERRVAANGDFTEFKAASFLGAAPASITMSRPRCKAEAEKCLPYFEVTQADFRADIKKHALYLERYRSMRGYPQFSERVISPTVNSPFPEYTALVTLSDLADAEIGLQVAMPGTRRQAMEQLAAELELWRRMARESDTLITQMIALTVIQRKLSLASEIMAAYPATVRQYPATMAQVTAPIPLKDMSLNRPLQGEFRFFSDVYRNLGQAAQLASVEGNVPSVVSDGALRMGAYKPNASINKAYSRLQDNIQLFAGAPKDILAGHATLLQRQVRLNAWNPAVYVYNPVGKILDAVAVPDISRYAFRLIDVVGLSRMVELQRRNIEAGPQGKGPATRLAASDVLANPYTDQPFDWNVAKNTLAFEGHGGRGLKDGRMVIELGER